MKLTHRDALKILNIKASAAFEEIKTAYRRASKVYHPDRNPAGLEMMKLVNAAYQALSDYTPTDEIESEEVEANLGEELNAALNAIHGLDLEIEICGSWIWVGGDTRAHKEILKEAGYKWAPVKKLWHYSVATEKKCFSRGKYSMDDIRSRHGSQFVKSVNNRRLGA